MKKGNDHTELIDSNAKYNNCSLHNKGWLENWFNFNPIS